jgi:hypothetical protein
VFRLMDGFFYHDGRWYNIWPEDGHIKWESGFPEQPGVVWASGTADGAWMGFQILVSGNASPYFCVAESLDDALAFFESKNIALIITKALRPK